MLRSLRSLRVRLNRVPLAGPKNECSGPEKGSRAARPGSGLWGRGPGKAGLLTRAFSRPRSASLRSLRAAADALIVGRLRAAKAGQDEKERIFQGWQLVALFVAFARIGRV